LKDGAYLVTAKGFVEQAQEQKMVILSEEEKDLVRKLLAVRFERRIPKDVDRMLSQKQKQVLAGLMKKRVVKIFHGKKYRKTGVYSISDFAFSQARESAGQKPSTGSSEHLEKFGWMVLESEPEARNFANSFPEKIKSGKVMGTRAFDMKYYFVKKTFAEKWEGKTLSCLSKSAKSTEQIAKETGIGREGCLALLMHMCENGEAIEKRKGTFARA